MGRVVARLRGWLPERGTPANKLFHVAVRYARSRRSQSCVSTYVLENDRHVLKSIRGVNAAIHRALPHVEKTL